ncbi:uncharacterized protein N7482_008291 [Penicillium canariense]|uniref:Uncharacterized protein n=1 Tax=Penicillium canariense TaxID=189055 RepID=A0A9W9HWB7_9EURO|nr:uncharacterized protein N7482_008291 [Penicillium canariense]KAJ5157191.1 hypothetical protein N7482_008291 [Penicillium canariense]
MGPDSFLLISETMLPESGVLLPSVISDMQMMGSFASLEQIRDQWPSSRAPVSSLSTYGPRDAT